MWISSAAVKDIIHRLSPTPSCKDMSYLTLSLFWTDDSQNIYMDKCCSICNQKDQNNSSSFGKVSKILILKSSFCQPAWNTNLRKMEIMCLRNWYCKAFFYVRISLFGAVQMPMSVCECIFFYFGHLKFCNKYQFNWDTLILVLDSATKLSKFI